MGRGLRDANVAADLFEHEKPRPAPDHEGHRQRLKDRFAKAGPGALHDYELLELILFSAIPRQDTKPIAKALLRRFNNSFAEVIGAPPALLKEVKGVGDAVVQRATNHAWANRSDRPVRMLFVLIDAAISDELRAAAGPLEFFDQVLD